MAVPSPCIQVCRIDPASGLCSGCLRTLDEIARWSALPDADKLRVWRLIRQRRTQVGSGADTPRGPTPLAA